MGPLDLLSEALIDILKEFSAEKRLLSLAALKKALVSREDILSLFDPSPGADATGGGNGASAPVVQRAPRSPAEPRESTKSNLEPMPNLKDLLLGILDSLAFIVMGKFEKRYGELYEKTRECESVLSLIPIGDEITQLLGELMEESTERMNISNDFLIELSKDLHKVEEHLLTYRDYSRESHEITTQFNNYLLENTNDVHLTFDAYADKTDLRTVITSKLNMLIEAIEDKTKVDDLRHQEADSKICELQNNLKTYEEEILQVRERTETLEKEVMLDELTQINNRRAYDLQIRENLRRYHRDGLVFSLILIDIDHFKRVNDTYGHMIGDSCLKEVARLTKSSIRESDFLARYGGEEFIIILEGCDVSNARSVAEKIRSCIEKARFHFQDESISVTVSLGVTEVTSSDTEPDTPFTRVDEAMYRAKNDGRNRVRVVIDLSSCKLPAGDFRTGQPANREN
ncbi:MAG TPA: GGDEF domain-containing protein [Syntrophobacteraceae bacterium]|nr:GGDEF domain-containing protein [Syntrophobacteraceae bacterium]